VALTLAGGAAAASGEDGRYIVSFTPGHAEDGRRALRAARARVVLSLDPQGAVAAHIPAAALRGLQHNPNVEYIEEDVIRTPSAMWNDVTSGGETTPYGIQMVQAGMVNGANAGNWMVCIIDSGYSEQHEDLKDEDVTANRSNPQSGSWNKDSCGHGSHVAGTVSAISGNGKGVVGVAPEVKLHIVKMFGDDNLTGGNCSWTYSSTLVNALNKCVPAGANVVSMSLGGAFRSQTEARASANAYDQGVLSVAAAGNGGNKQTSYPAGYPSVISVAAVDADEKVAGFSQQNVDVELSAPGVGVLSTVPWLDLNTLSAGGSTVAGQQVENSARTDG
jgi:hypothetical protein